MQPQNSQETISLSWHTDWTQGKTAWLSLSKGNKVCLPAPLKLILPPPSCEASLLTLLSLEFSTFPGSLSGPRFYKLFIANRIWLRREYIHHAVLSFSKVKSLENAKTCPAVYVFLRYRFVCQVKSLSKSSLKVQRKWRENKRHLRCVCSRV